MLVVFKERPRPCPRLPSINADHCVTGQGSPAGAVGAALTADSLRVGEIPACRYHFCPNARDENRNENGGGLCWLPLPSACRLLPLSLTAPLPPSRQRLVPEGRRSHLPSAACRASKRPPHAALLGHWRWRPGCGVPGLSATTPPVPCR